MNELNQNGAAPQELAIPKMPVQSWTTIYDLHTGLKQGTIFPDLNKTFYMGGVEGGR